MKSRWIEIWVDSVAAKYVLAVRPAEDGRIEICDPQEQWKAIELFDDYESAVHWLNADEYDLAEGRLERDS